MNGTNEGGHPETMLVAIPSSNVIPGLECLLPLSQIFVRQQIDVLEVLVGFEQSNRYVFFAPNGQMVYIGDEESNCCARQYCGSARGFVLHIRDPNGFGILLDRPLQCCLTSMSVFAISTGQLLGTIQQQCVLCSGARFNVNDEMGNVVFIIKAPCCTTACCGNVSFDASF
ncbi:phospholipid scramblase 1 [Folsomia candida]|uniref:phospholipid scramblase 1 n=1 Tax=Folsomia candida TaxID=158441 RepID=UPI001604C81B|nr:phospholipid scramblase 1 [Folsomia candida]